MMCGNTLVSGARFCVMCGQRQAQVAGDKGHELVSDHRVTPPTPVGWATYAKQAFIIVGTIAAAVCTACLFLLVALLGNKRSFVMRDRRGRRLRD
jgi:hypothetical protein